MRVGVLAAQLPFAHRGEEGRAEGLCAALREAGVETEIVSMPFGGYAPEAMADQMLACQLVDITESCGVRIDRVIALDFPAWFMPHPNKVLWIRHFPERNGVVQPMLGEGAEAVGLVEQAERALFGRVRKIFTQSLHVAERLRATYGVAGAPLYRPLPQAADYAWREAGDFFFVPERLAASKRSALLLEALGLTRGAVKMVFAGGPEEAAYGAEMRRRAEVLGPGRVVFLGDVGAVEMRLLYGSCLGVVAPAADAAHGDVALAAMLSAKPVIACTDSGGKLDFVTNGETGVVCAPEAAALAEAMDGLWQDRGKARKWGKAALGQYDALGLSWKKVVETLLA